MPILGLPTLDNFNRIENPLSTHWAAWAPSRWTNAIGADGTFAVVQSTGNGFGAVYYTVSFGPNCGVFVQLSGTAGNEQGQSIWLGLRMSNLAASTFSGYQIFYSIDNSDNVSVGVFLDGVTQIGSTQALSWVYAQGDEFGASMSGSVITFYRNGSPIGATVSDSTYTLAGFTGFGMQQAGNIADNFGGGTIIPVGADTFVESWTSQGTVLMSQRRRMVPTGYWVQAILSSIQPPTGDLPVTAGLADTGNCVTNGTNLQTALNAAKIGDTIVVQAGTSYCTASTNGFTFPALGASWDNRRTTLCSSALPRMGSRASPGWGAAFATLATTVKGPTLGFSGTRGWTLQGLEVTYTSAVQTGASVQQLVDMTSAVADITFDRCWIHPLESATNPNSIFRATNRGIHNITDGLANFQVLGCYIDGYTGWGYDHTQNWMAAMYSFGSTHLRVKNSFLQGFRTWYLDVASTGSSDVVIQFNTFDCPLVWTNLTDPSSGTQFMPNDHRHLIFYAGTNAIVVGNTFTGFTNRGSLGIFFNQAGTSGLFQHVLFLSNFQDQSQGALCQIVIYHTPSAGSDLAFVNNLTRGIAFFAGNDSAWANEFGGPTGVTAGHGINTYHNTLRNIFSALYHTDTVNPSAFCDIRYNVSQPGANYLATAAVNTDFPNLNIVTNRFIGDPAARPAYVSVDQVFATDALAGMANASIADAGGPITNYALTSGTGGADFGTDHGCNITTLQAALNGTSTDWDYPEQPRVLLTTTYSLPVGGTTYNVNSGDAADFQAKLNVAVPGDVINLVAGSTYTGNFFLRNTTDNGKWIYIQSSALASLPAAGTRVAPTDATNMPLIQTNNSDPAIEMTGTMCRYRFVGCQITTTTSATTQLILLDLTGGNTVAANMPHDFTFDRCYIHGGGTDVKRAIRGMANNVAVVDSYLSNFRSSDRSDTQTMNFLAGAGIKIVNNFLEASAENVMFGGDSSTIAQFTPADVEIRNNFFTKRAAWNPSSGSYGGVLYAVKNLLEMKNVQRILVNGNTFDGYWGQDQGMSITMTPRDQNGDNPWSRITDVTFTNNTMQNYSVGYLGQVTGGIVISGKSDLHPVQRTDRIRIQYNNMCGNVGMPNYTFQIFSADLITGPNHVIIDHNTCTSSSGIIQMDQGTTNNFVFTNNIQSSGGNGVVGNGTSTIAATFAAYAPGAIFDHNILIGTPPGGTPAGNTAVANTAAVGFTNFAGNDLTVTTSSICYRAATEGQNIGYAV